MFPNINDGKNTSNFIIFVHTLSKQWTHSYVSVLLMYQCTSPAVITNTTLSLKSDWHFFSQLKLQGILILSRLSEHLPLKEKHQKPEQEKHEKASSLPLPNSCCVLWRTCHSTALIYRSHRFSWDEKWLEQSCWTASSAATEMFPAVCPYCSPWPHVAKDHLKSSSQWSFT